jgi:hypothetical protein
MSRFEQPFLSRLYDSFLKKKTTLFSRDMKPNKISRFYFNETKF